MGAEEAGATVQNFYVYGNLIIHSGRGIGAFESNVNKIIQNIKLEQSNVKIMYGEQAISKIYIGDTLIYSI